MTRRPVVLVTRRLDPAAHQRISRDYEAVLNEDAREFTAGELLQLCQHVDAVIACNGEPFNSDVISSLPGRFRIIACSFQAANLIDLDAAKAQGVVVTHCGDPSNSPMDAQKTLDAVDAVFNGYEPDNRLA